MIEGIRRLNLETIFGNVGKARGCFSLAEAIEGSKFPELPALWSCRGILPSLSPGRTDGGVGYCSYNPFTSRFISEGEATVVIRGMDRRVPSGHVVGWDCSEID